MFGSLHMHIWDYLAIAIITTIQQFPKKSTPRCATSTTTSKAAPNKVCWCRRRAWTMNMMQEMKFMVMESDEVWW